MVNYYYRWIARICVGEERERARESEGGREEKKGLLTHKWEVNGMPGIYDVVVSIWYWTIYIYIYTYRHTYASEYPPHIWYTLHAHTYMHTYTPIYIHSYIHTSIYTIYIYTSKYNVHLDTNSENTLCGQYSMIGWLNQNYHIHIL